LGLEHVLGLASDLAEVLLISYQQVEVHHLLVEQHASNLSNVNVTVSLLNAGVDHVSNELLLLFNRLQGLHLSNVSGCGQGHGSELLGGLALDGCAKLVLVLGLGAGVLRVLALLGLTHGLATSATLSTLTGSHALLLVVSLGTAVGLATTHQLVLDVVDG